MVGGLIVSQALTLFTTPVIYLYLGRLSAWSLSWRSAPHEKEPSVASEGEAVANRAPIASSH
jgi:hypothetical protein